MGSLQEWIETGTSHPCTVAVGNVKHTYTILDGKVVREAYGNVTVDYARKV